jgi:chemotaxis protein CheY-P-specific phosphatase CheC
MNTIELQNSIIREILNISDEQLLVYLNDILRKKADLDIYKLSEFETEFVEESLEDYQNGNTVDNDDVFNETEKWLDE